MHIVILSARTGWQTDELGRALQERGHTGCVLPYEGLVARLGVGSRSDPTGAEVVSVRLTRERARPSSMPTPVLRSNHPTGSLEQIIYRSTRGTGLRSAACGRELAARDRALRGKFYTTAYCRKPGSRYPRPSCEGAEDALAAIRAMGDANVKPIFGSLGHGMVRVTIPTSRFALERSSRSRSVF